MGDLSRNFSRSEFACHDGCGFADPDPKLVAGLQQLRDIVNQPITIVSGCRCQAHNRAVGGEPHSQHLLGNAADIKIKGFLPRGIRQEALEIPVFKAGGIGIYDTWVHVDVRGYVARWDETTSVKEA